MTLFQNKLVGITHELQSEKYVFVDMTIFSMEVTECAAFLPFKIFVPFNRSRPICSGRNAVTKSFKITDNGQTMVLDAVRILRTFFTLYVEISVSEQNGQVSGTDAFIKDVMTEKNVFTKRLSNGVTFVAHFFGWGYNFDLTVPRILADDSYGAL